MQTSLLTRLPSMTLAVMLTLVVAQGLVFSPEAHAAGGGKLEGTWLMEVTIVNCTTGAPLPIPGNPFPALHTYMRNGMMLRTGAPPPPAPPSTAVALSTAHGIWEHTGGQTFRERFRFFSFNAAGVHVSTSEITVERSLIQGNNAETDEIIGAGTGKFFTPTGMLVGEGCTEDRGRRVAFEEEE
jgi:hypothetical protein